MIFCMVGKEGLDKFRSDFLFVKLITRFPNYGKLTEFCPLVVQCTKHSHYTQVRPGLVVNPDRKSLSIVNLFQ